MTAINDVMLRLLDEIDSICKKENLSYYLSGNALKQAYDRGTLAEDINIAEVLMPLNDIFVLEKCIRDNQDRTLESIFTNSDFRYFFFKYVANDTTYFGKTFDSTSQACGIHIRIRVLKQDSKTKESDRATVMKGYWNRFHRRYPYKWIVQGSRIERFKSNLIMTKISLRRKQYYAEMLKNICLSQKTIDWNETNYINCRRYDRGSANRIYFPKGMFADYTYIELEGHKYRTVNDIDEFLYTIHSAETDDEGEAIINAEIPYQEYTEYLSSKGFTTDFRKINMDLAIARAAYKKADKPVSNAWRDMQKAVLEKKLKPEFDSIRSDVLEYYNEKQWDKLGDALEEFDSWSRAYVNRGVSLSFDEEIMEAYLGWLKHCGENELAKKIRKNIEKETKAKQ